ncbi:MAG: hypothetical protein MPJ79_04465 [Alphaproteobacteria bacterium]|nr:hypothetical protein [Alphaproteobacteria bacterium]MDA7989389.1 hypothetical protein [Alphaproteobacteria bacterium]MDA8009445.1 hypothetical protein [Alphaproteobacteria bacterium]MDA8030088.1 hypothetical protein [Alphaproteobacteria bacterium]
MTDVEPKHLARVGEFLLEKAVTDVLLEAKREGECIGPAEISRRAGIYRGKSSGYSMYDAIVQGILYKLEEHERVTRCDQPSGKKRGWELTDKEFASRQDDPR